MITEGRPMPLGMLRRAAPGRPRGPPNRPRAAYDLRPGVDTERRSGWFGSLGDTPTRGEIQMVRSAKRQRVQLIHRLHEDGASSDEIVESIQRRENCTPLTAFRYLNRLSQESAARRYNELHNIHFGDPGYMT